MGIISDFKKIKDRLEHGPVEHDLHEYREILEKVNQIDFRRLNDTEIKVNNLGAKMINGGNQGFASMTAAFSGPMALGVLIYERFFKKKVK